MNRKIAVFTGARAEYGLLQGIIQGLHDSEKIDLQLMVGGMHLSSEFGKTVEQIEQDGFPISDRLEFLLSSDTAVGICKSMGLALISVGEAFERNRPDLIVLLGDRVEALAVAQAAMISCIPIAHIHGGEVTAGVVDEAVRHSITKMSHLHFVATEVYRHRVIQLGEQPSQVFNCGAPGVDNMLRMNLLDKRTLIELTGFDLGEKFFLVTFHPVTLESGGGVDSLLNLLAALDEYPDFQLVITYPNADVHGRRLIEILDDYRRKNANRVYLAQSLGQLRYLSLMKLCEAVIGNSSSGLIEAPSFNVPTVNIGIRQEGRIAGDSVIQCEETLPSIKGALERALSSNFKEACGSSTNPYGNGGTVERILDVIVNIPLQGILKKTFYDLD